MFRILLILTLIPVAAAAIEVIYLGPLDEMPVIDPSTDTAGIVGRPGQPGHLLDPQVHSGLAAATTFDPLVYDLPCEAGMLVRAIHLVVARVDDFGYPLVPSPSFADGSLRSDHPPGTECFAPDTVAPDHGRTYCRDVQEGLMLEEDLGFYELIYRDFDAECGCIDMLYTQALAINTPSSPEIRLVTNIEPGHCPDHRLVPQMQGIARWFAFEAPGNLVVWAEVDCCETPVETTMQTWSTIREMFR